MKILLASPIDSGAVTALRQRHEVIDACTASAEELKKQIADCEVLVFRSGVSVDAGLLAAAAALRLVVRAGSGLDNIDLAALQRRDIPLVRIAEPGARAVAELTFGLILALARQILAADRLLRSGHWAKHQLQGTLLQGKTLGIVGLGNIGGVTARLGTAWGMEVVGCVAHPHPERRAALAAQQILLADLAEVLAMADFVVVLVPLTPSTRSLIGAAELARMKPGALLINMARGGVVDELALRTALQTPGGLAGAALDVHHQEGENQVSPLAALTNVILTPHIGAMTVDTQREIGRRVVTHIETFTAGEVPP